MCRAVSGTAGFLLLFVFFIQSPPGLPSISLRKSQSHPILYLPVLFSHELSCFCFIKLKPIYHSTQFDSDQDKAGGDGFMKAVKLQRLFFSSIVFDALRPAFSTPTHSCSVLVLCQSSLRSSCIHPQLFRALFSFKIEQILKNTTSPH